MKKIIILIIVVLVLGGFWYSSRPEGRTLETLIANLMVEKDFPSISGYKIFETLQNENGQYTGVLFGAGDSANAFAIAVFEGEVVKKSFVLQEEGAYNKLEKLVWKSANEITFEQTSGGTTVVRTLTIK